jgi:hypothetical protein
MPIRLVVLQSWLPSAPVLLDEDGTPLQDEDGTYLTEE